MYSTAEDPRGGSAAGHDSWRRWMSAGVLAGILTLSGCATQVNSSAPAAPIAASVATAAVPAAPAHDTAQSSAAELAPASAYCPADLRFPGFPERYQDDLRSFACILQQHYGLPAALVIPALQSAHYDSRAVSLMSPPPPSSVPQAPLPWWRYRERFLSAQRLDSGVRFWREHRRILEDVAEKYGVPPPILLGILNIETGFGSFMGNFPVLDANLSLSLALKPRRAFFLAQTAETLKLAEKLGRPVSALRGSPAGAMGMSQFLASSYLKYGVVWNDPPGEGLPNLWQSVPDVLASTANFFRAHGWQPGQPVLVPALISRGSAPETSTRPDYTLAQLARLGVYPERGRALLPADTRVGLLRLEGRTGPHYYLAYPNFYAIMGYNPSVYYSATVWAYAEALGRIRG
ncbi:lytic murein transglycosylase [Acidithiobacillus caldus]|uniref:lytic murein transglycosylase n=1 Tax=Acidithiobacillus caldus TaxID=33059 RepID=UPI000A9262EC|nr:lytic murein transglycosylase [Acidithiobacillus caldus]